MRISVIIPTYNPTEEYLGTCLQSLTRQTLQKDCWEVIIIKNGPLKGSMPLDDLPTLFPTQSLRILNIPQAGVSNARNIGIENALGDYICFIDDDDWVSDDYLEKLSRNTNEQTITSAFVVRKESPDSHIEKDDYLGRTYQKFYGYHHIDILHGRRFLGSACCKLIPRRIIGSYRFNTRFAMGEDALFMATLSKDIDILRPADGQPTYYRRTAPNSATRMPRSLYFRVTNIYQLWRAYISVYLSDPSHYSLSFFVNRLFAVATWIYK